MLRDGFYLRRYKDNHPFAPCRGKKEILKVKDGKCIFYYEKDFTNPNWQDVNQDPCTSYQKISEPTARELQEILKQQYHVRLISQRTLLSLV